MASPPSGSPSSSLSLALPRQRPSGLTLALPKSHKPSHSPSSGSAHPLRQTSFPPPDSLEAQHQLAEDKALGEFSADEDDLDEDSEITSAISGPTGDAAFAGQKRKRAPGERRPRGRPVKVSNRAGSVSVVNGEDGRSTAGGRRAGTAGASSMVNGEADDDDDDDDDDVEGTADGDVFNAQTLEQDNRKRYLFREAVGPEHQDRYDVYNRVKLRSQEVRRLVNATLSQSVPPNVISVVQSYTKMFAGMLIEGAREVQAEWMAVHPETPDMRYNRASKRLRMLQAEEEELRPDESGEDKRKEAEDDKGQQLTNGKTEETEDANRVLLYSIPSSGSTTQEDSSHTQTTQPSKPTANSKRDDGREELLADLTHVQPGAWGLSKYIDECDRGPLLPDHLRESLRRYKTSRSGGSVGFTGISLERPEIAAPRMGGKRLFR